ncbi:MAG: helix-turn-helix transcriptional regulator [Aerococcus sanguinicola]
MGCELGQRIKKIRVEKKMTLEQFAEAIKKNTEGASKTGKSNVSKWERSENVPNDITLKAIADLAGTTVDDLLGEEYCEWSKSAHRLSWASMYATDCGEGWIDNSTKSIKGFNYCPYCGKKIKVVSDDEL